MVIIIILSVVVGWGPTFYARPAELHSGRAAGKVLVRRKMNSSIRNKYGSVQEFRSTLGNLEYLVEFSLVWLNLVWLGLDGLVWFDLVRFGSVL